MKIYAICKTHGALHDIKDVRKKNKGTCVWYNCITCERERSRKAYRTRRTKQQKIIDEIHENFLKRMNISSNILCDRVIEGKRAQVKAAALGLLKFNKQEK